MYNINAIISLYRLRMSDDEFDDCDEVKIAIILYISCSGKRMWTINDTEKSVINFVTITFRLLLNSLKELM